LKVSGAVERHFCRFSILARLEQLILLKHWFSRTIGEIHADVAPRFGLLRLRFGAGMGLGGGGLVCLARGGSAI
jgi:hypothetical protein